jgi:hypothetical protein
VDASGAFLLVVWTPHGPRDSTRGTAPRERSRARLSGKCGFFLRRKIYFSIITCPFRPGAAPQCGVEGVGSEQMNSGWNCCDLLRCWGSMVLGPPAWQSATEPNRPPTGRDQECFGIGLPKAQRPKGLHPWEAAQQGGQRFRGVSSRGEFLLQTLRYRFASG